MAPDRAFEVSADRMHGWLLADVIRVITAPQADDWLHGTLIFPADRNPLEDLPTAAAVEDYLRPGCPTLARLLPPEEAEARRQRPVSEVRMVKCDRMHVDDSILLIGDAVHAVSPSVGHGCSAALQDVQAFCRLLDQHADDWSRTLPAFTADRLPEAYALRDLSDYSVPRSKMMRFDYLFRLLVGTKLNRWFPTWPQPLPMHLLSEGEMPYSEVLRRTQGWINRVRRSIDWCHPRARRYGFNAGRFRRKISWSTPPDRASGPVNPWMNAKSVGSARSLSDVLAPHCFRRINDQRLRRYP